MWSLPTIYEASSESQSIGRSSTASLPPHEEEKEEEDGDASFESDDESPTNVQYDGEQFYDEECGPTLASGMMRDIPELSPDFVTGESLGRKWIPRDVFVVALVAIALGAVAGFAYLGVSANSSSNNNNNNGSPPSSTSSGRNTDPPGPVLQNSNTQVPTLSASTLAPSVSPTLAQGSSNLFLSQPPTGQGNKPHQNDPTGGPPFFSNPDPSASAAPSQAPTDKADTEIIADKCPQDPRLRSPLKDEEEAGAMQGTAYQVNVRQSASQTCMFRGDLAVRLTCSEYIELLDSSNAVNCRHVHETEILCTSEEEEFMNLIVKCSESMHVEAGPGAAACFPGGFVQVEVGIQPLCSHNGAFWPLEYEEAWSQKQQCLDGAEPLPNGSPGCRSRSSCGIADDLDDCLLVTRATMQVQPPEISNCTAGVKEELAEGQDCQDDAECASNVCVEGVCWGGPLCDNFPCSSPNHCQSGICVEGACQSAANDTSIGADRSEFMSAAMNSAKGNMTEQNVTTP